MDGTRAAEVQTVFRGVVTNTRVLSTLNAQNKTGAGNAMFFAGLGLAAIALIAFVATAMSVGAEKQAYEDWQTAGKEAKNFVWPHRNPAMDVLVFGGLIGAIALSYMGLKRRTTSSPTPATHSHQTTTHTRTTARRRTTTPRRTVPACSRSPS